MIIENGEIGPAMATFEGGICANGTERKVMIEWVENMLKKWMNHARRMAAK